MMAKSRAAAAFACAGRDCQARACLLEDVDELCLQNWALPVPQAPERGRLQRPVLPVKEEWRWELHVHERRRLRRGVQG